MSQKPRFPGLLAGIQREVGNGVPVHCHRETDKRYKPVGMFYSQKGQTGEKAHPIVMPLPPGDHRPHLIGEFLPWVRVLHKGPQLFILLPLGLIGFREKPRGVGFQALL